MKDLDKEIKKRLDQCCIDIAMIMDRYFPEVRASWNAKDPHSFEERVRMSIYLELIHAGFFK